jgi:serine/threonine-protein kinase
MASSRSDLVSRAKSRVGTVLKDKFTLDSILGVGGMATVYAATHRNGKKVAVKLLHPTYAADPDLVKRFLREGYVANKIEHPGCVNVLDDDADGDAVFLVMELLEGQSLEKFTRTGGTRMPLEQILRVADEALDVLAVAHAKGITHRDIKPANLFLTRDGRTKVLDFGIARVVGAGIDGSATQTGMALGTPAFMPPEQARGRKNEIDARTDLWSLGATMFALIVGDRPRRAETGAEELLLAMTAPMPALRERAPDVPMPIAAVIDRALAFEREARWPDARTMQAALRQAAGSLVDVPRDASAPRVDTAPIVVGSSSQLHDPTTQLATGATLAGARRSARPGARGKTTAAFVAACVGTLAVGAIVLLAASRGTNAPHASAGAGPVSSPASIAPAPSPRSSAPTPAASASSAATPASALPPAPTPPLPPPAVNLDDLPAVPGAPASPSKPVAPRAPAAAPSPPANPLDKRF